MQGGGFFPLWYRAGTVVVWCKDNLFVVGLANDWLMKYQPVLADEINQSSAGLFVCRLATGGPHHARGSSAPDRTGCGS